jgi:CelD/BcsL family acetyltransferase involved in cellulose biosynthesis
MEEIQDRGQALYLTTFGLSEAWNKLETERGIERENTSARRGTSGVEVVRTVEQFSELRSAWARLVERAIVSDYYLTHDWLQGWLRHFYPNEAYFVLFWKDGEIEFAAPMVCRRRRYHGLQIRELALTRDWYSPVSGLLCTGTAYDNVDMLMRHLASAGMAWDVLDFDGLPMEQEGSKALLRWIDRLGWPSHAEDSFGNWILRGFRSWDDYWKGKAKRKQRRKSIVYRDRLLELGNVRTRIISNGGEVDAAFGQFYEICERSWKEGAERHPEFVKSTMRLAAKKDALRIAFLDLDDKPIASWYAFVHGSTAYLPRTGYDARFRRYMPGLVLLEDFLRHLIEVDRVDTIDFQHGDEAYKSVWANERRLRKRIVVANPRSWKGRLYVRAEYVYKPKLEPTLLWRLARRVRGLVSGKG